MHSHQTIPMSRSRRTFLAGIGASSIGLTAGCSGLWGGDEDVDANIAVIFSTGGLGDDSFNDSAYEGLQRADDEFNIDYTYVEPDDEGEFGSNQRTFAGDGDHDLIVCIGFQQVDPLEDNAPDYPDQNFLLVDDNADGDNIRNTQFRESEGSYLVGHLAGLLTQRDFAAGDGETNTDTNTVGFVGGIDSPLIREFEAGYKAGALAVDGDVDVVDNYVGDFSDQGAGQENANALYDDEGADIIYQAAGASGIGVFQAAQENDRFAIGADEQQSITASDFADSILGSMVKQVDEAVYDSIEDIVNDEFDTEDQTLGLEEGGVDIAYGDTIGDEIPDDIVDDIADAKDAIINGEIDVPTDPDEV